MTNAASLQMIAIRVFITVASTGSVVDSARYRADDDDDSAGARTDRPHTRARNAHHLIHPSAAARILFLGDHSPRIGHGFGSTQCAHLSCDYYQ